MTWHETIEFIQNSPEYTTLVKQAYFDQDLEANVRRFENSEEFVETIRFIKNISPSAKKILDIGAGNGIASINFALLGYDVFAVEPDGSDIVGIGAIKKLVGRYDLKNVQVFQQYAEDIQFPNESFDIVYFRQTMHHAANLKKFLLEAARVLKTGGLLLAIRDHVIFSVKDKRLFLASHPLQKFYGGENAFTPFEYKDAMELAGLAVEKEFKYYESVLNYFPLTAADIKKLSDENEKMLRTKLKSKLGILANFRFLLNAYKKKNSFDALPGCCLNEKTVPGRMYSYIARKLN